MKNKKLSWILLPAVLGIWAVIGWKVYAAMRNDESPFTDTGTAGISNADSPALPDTYELVLDYRDPFLDKPAPVKIQPSRHVVQGTTPVKPSRDSSATVSWPAISYYGLVRQPESGKTVGFLAVNGSSCFIRSGDNVGNILVGRINADSVEVIMGKLKKFVRK